MKIRTGFVSNSSSSSFICEVCDRIESGWDLGLRDAEMSECENGHIFCNSHKPEVSFEQIKEYYSVLDNCGREYTSESAKLETQKEVLACNNMDEFEEYADEADLFDYGCPGIFCPICTMTHISGDDLFAYLIKNTGQDKNVIMEEVKGRFPNYDKFMEYLK